MVKRYSDSVVTNTTAVAENLTNLMGDVRAEDILKSAVYYIDAIDSSSSGQTVDNLGTAKDLLPTTLGSSTAADSNDPKFLDFTGTNYVYGVDTNNYLSVPDSNDLDITGDIDLRAFIAADDWTPAASMAIFAKSGGAPNFSYGLRLETAGTVSFRYSTDGTTITSRTSTVAPTIADGQPLWVRATVDVDNGASGHTVTFFTSTNGTTWTQLGTAVTTAGTISLFSGTGGVQSSTNGNSAAGFSGKIFRWQIFNGIDGTKVLDVDTSVITAGSATSFTAVTGQTVTINRSTSGRKTVAVTQPTWLFGTDDYMEVNNRYMSSGTYLYLPGVNSNNCSTPDAAALDVISDIDIRLKLALDDWTPSAINLLLTKNGGNTTNRAYQLFINTNGTLGFDWTPDGTVANNLTSTSTVATGVVDGATKWIRVTLDVDNGSTQNETKFWTSDDGVTWTQLGTTITKSGTTSIFAGTGNLIMGTTWDNLLPTRGKFFRAQVLNGIDGTVAFDANFETGITSLNQTSFTESSTNAATVTINRSGSDYRSAGISAAGYLYPGATNTFKYSTIDYLNFGTVDDFTVISAARTFGASSASNERFVGKGVTTAPGPSSRYALRRSPSANTLNSIISDNSTGVSPTSSESIATGDEFLATSIVNRSTQVAALYVNATQSATSSISSIGSLSNLSTFGIGGIPAIGDYLSGEIYAVAVFRRPLAASEIALITSYFQRRDT